MRVAARASEKRRWRPENSSLVNHFDAENANVVTIRTLGVACQAAAPEATELESFGSLDFRSAFR